VKEIEIKCQGAGTLPLENLTQFQGNLKTITPANLKKLRSRIIDTGFVAPIFIWKNEKINYILDGTQRLLALKSLQSKGYHIPDLPVAYIEADNEEDARKKLLSITSTYGDFNLEELQGWLVKVDEDIADSLRFFDKELNFEMAEEKETIGDDEVNEEVEPVTKLGDLWELGKHRVLCGDSTDRETVDKLMDGKKADMVFTDPPYGMNLDTDWSDAKLSLKFAKDKNVLGGKKHKTVIGDNEDFSPALITTIFDNFGYCKEIFTWGADYYSEHLPDKNDGSWIVWDKRLDESADKMYGSTFELCWSKAKHKRMLARIKWAGIFGTEKEFDHKRYHPTQKPINLAEWFFDKWGKDIYLIADIYLGSGSTLIACEKTNRTCYGLEIDPYYTDVIVNRYITWYKANGKMPEVKLNGEPWEADYGQT